MTNDRAEALTATAKAEEVRKTVFGSQSLGDIALALLDLETTGLIIRDAPLPRIADIAVKLIKVNTCYTSLVDPEMDMPRSAMEIHGITGEMTRTAPTFKTIALALVDLVSRFVCPQDNIIFLAHNGSKFDEPILRSEFSRCEVSIPDNWRFADSLCIFKSLLPREGPKSFSLGALHNRLLREGISNQHRAAGDVEGLERCLRALFARGDFESNVVSVLCRAM